MTSMSRGIMASSCLLLRIALVAFQASSHPDSSLFRPLELPPPNAYRDGVGRPGPHYWQQRVNYSIDAVLDTSSQSISGHELMRYINNSPDTLRQLWFQLDQNIYRSDSRGALRFPELA